MSGAFLDFFFITAVLFMQDKFFPTSAENAAFYVALALSIATWIWWRLSRNALPAVLCATALLGMWLSSGEATATLFIWLALVVLFLQRQFVAVYVAVAAVAAAFIASLVVSSLSVGMAIVSAVSMVLIVLAGLNLGFIAMTAVENDAELRRNRAQLAEANAQLQQELFDARDLTLADERARIAAALHDGLGHKLTSIGLGLDFGIRTIESAPERAREELTRARVATSEALNDMRTTVRALHPVDLTNDNLAGALTSLSDSFASTGLQVDVDVDQRVAERLDKDAEMLIVRATQEGLTNIARHAQASNAVISLAASSDAEGFAAFSVSDNGRGAESIKPGFGLTTLRQRAEALGGSLTIPSLSPGDSGFTFSISLPLHTSTE